MHYPEMTAKQPKNTSMTAALVFILSFVLSNMPLRAADSHLVDPKSVFSWDVLFVYGYSTKNPKTIEIAPEKLQEYLYKSGLKGSIGISSPLAPEYIINKKNTPIWFAVFAFSLRESDAHEAAYTGKQSVFAPPSFVRKNFDTHINWPRRYLSAYLPQTPGCYKFVLPLMVPKLTEFKSDLPYEIASGTLIVGIQKFEEQAPENLLKTFSGQCPQFKQQSN